MPLRMKYRMTKTYDKQFHQWVNMTALRSAGVIVPLIQKQVTLTSVLDVGCGHGAWLKIWSQLGGVEIFGLDGAHVDKEALLIPFQRFQFADLQEDWSLYRRFDMVQCLEVAEHLPPASAEGFVRRLCQHGDVVLFSAAQPGQGGERHVNERRPSYWAHLFLDNGFLAFDSLRPLVAQQKLVDPWYRYNTVIFANPTGADRLTAVARACRITNLTDLDQGGDLAWQVRRIILRPLPEPIVTHLSRLRYRLLLAHFNRAS